MGNSFEIPPADRRLPFLTTFLGCCPSWRLKINPLRATKRLMEWPGRLRLLSLEEIPRLLACYAPPHMLRDIVMVAPTTGMHRGGILTNGMG